MVAGTYHGSGLSVNSKHPFTSNSHCGQGPAETGGFCASDLQTGLISWLESGLGVALVWLWCGFGVALVWLWGSSVLRSLCLVYA